MAAPLAVLAIATPFVTSWEGFIDHRYDDGTGVQTVGIGFIASDFPPGQFPEHMTLAEAEAVLSRKLGGVYYQPIADLMHQADLSLNDNQQAALLSFVFNLGPGIIGTDHDIGRLLRAHDLKAAANAMLEYDDPGTDVTAGLFRRRKAERALFLKPWTDPDPYHYSRFDTTDRRVGAGRKASERETCEEYDRKRRRWLRWPGRLRRLRDNCAVLEARIEDVEDHGGSPAVDWREWRKAELSDRAAGRRVAG